MKLRFPLEEKKAVEVSCNPSGEGPTAAEVIMVSVPSDLNVGHISVFVLGLRQHDFGHAPPGVLKL